tara:strand:+ start:943 stop:1386 length:444 start_codon:yes stop_codon:yes gene_type:complete
MTLKELQGMIKEEFDAYMGEAEDDVDVSVSDNDIDAEMGDEMEDAGEEDVLRSIFDLLKTHFEGGEEEMGMDDEMPMDDAEGEEAPDSDLDEISNVGFGDSGGKENPKTGGKDAGYKPFKKTSGHTGYDGSSKALQERFQKLANIIK